MKANIKIFKTIFITSLLISTFTFEAYSEPKQLNLTNTTNLNDKTNETINLLLNDYYNLKAKKESYDLDKEILKYKKENNIISKYEYNQQKYPIEIEKNNIELEINNIYIKLNELGFSFMPLNETNFQGKDINILQNELKKLKIEQNKIELEKKQLELKYISGECSREDFIKSYAPLEKQDYDIHLKIEPLAKTISYLKKSYWKNYRHY